MKKYLGKIRRHAPLTLFASSTGLMATNFFGLPGNDLLLGIWFGAAGLAGGLTGEWWCNRDESA